MGIFGQSKRADPKEEIRKIQHTMRGEMRKLDRQVHGIEREEMKVKKEIKDAAKKGDKDVCVVLAKGLLQSRKAVTKIHASKAQMNSVLMGMQQQVSTMRMAGSLQQSTEVMRSMQQLVKVPEMMATMRELSREMMRVGIIDEMIEETMESVEPEELEEQAQAEVDKILFEITAGELGKAPTAVADSFVEPERAAAAAEAVDFEEMKIRLNSLKN